VRRVGLIGNLGDVPEFVASRYEDASAEEVMRVTGGNTGNVAFVYGVRKLLGDRVTRIEWGMSPDVVNREVDHIVVCCANQLGEHVDLGGWADRLAHFDKPVTLVGLGAQAPDTTRFPDLPDGTLRFLSVVKERVAGGGPNIAARGHFTQRFLKSLGIPSVAAGCPSLHISSVGDLGRQIIQRQRTTELERVAVAAGNPWHTPSARLEVVLVEIIERWRGEYIVQHPVGMLKFAYGECERIDEETRDRFLDTFGGRFDQRSLMEWFRRYSAVYVDASTWIRSLKRFDVVLGPRYHGVALGVQAGVPGRVVTIDSRTEELCEGTGIPSVAVSSALDFDADQLVHASRWSEEEAENFDNVRKLQRHAYLDFLERQRLQPSVHLSGE
jgi:hypothetical protein